MRVRDGSLVGRVKMKFSDSNKDSIRDSCLSYLCYLNTLLRIDNRQETVRVFTSFAPTRGRGGEAAKTNRQWISVAYLGLGLELTYINSSWWSFWHLVWPAQPSTQCMLMSLSAFRSLLPFSISRTTRCLHGPLSPMYMIQKTSYNPEGTCQCALGNMPEAIIPIGHRTWSSRIIPKRNVIFYNRHIHMSMFLVHIIKYTALISRLSKVIAHDYDFMHFRQAVRGQGLQPSEHLRKYPRQLLPSGFRWVRESKCKCKIAN